MIGQTISHYRILEKLGQGGMGTVYKAEDTKLKRIVALKFLSGGLTFDEEAKTRFIQEAQAASALQHHNICTIHEIDETADGSMFICMDFYSGEMLKAKIERGPLPLENAVDIVSQAAEGLTKAHQAGMVHRDIKPANITQTTEGVVKVLDFGLAKLADRTRVTKTGTTVGTVAYMSPEQARGEEVDAGTDVWSLGAVLYELLTGQLPFQASHETAMLYAILNESHRPVASIRSEVPESLANIVDKALAKNRNERYRSAGELAADLRAVASELKTSGETAVGGKGGGRTKKRYFRLLLPVLLVAIIAIAGLLLKPVLFEDGVVSAPRPIAVISFENRTGDGQYDYLREVIPNLLITSLEQSKYLSVVTWERMRDLLAQAGRGDVEVIDGETGFEVCRMDGIDAIILGSFSKAGDVFVTDAKVLDVHSKELLKSVSARGNGVGSILAGQIDELGRELSKGVGLSERAIADGSQPIAEITTRSMDAYNYYLRGREEWYKHYFEDAKHSLERAVELDSTFAVAWLYLGHSQLSLREENASNISYARAKTLSVSAPEKDRLQIEASYANIIEKDDRKYFALLSELAWKYPKEKLAHFQLGKYYDSIQRFEDARQAFLKAISLDPNFGEALNGIAYLLADEEDYDEAIRYFERYAQVNPGDANPLDSMAEMYYRLGRLDEAIATYQKAVDLKPGFGSERFIGLIYALREDYTGAIGWLDRFTATSPPPGMIASVRLLEAIILNACCKRQAALEATGEINEIFVALGRTFGLAGTYWLEGWIHYNMGSYRQSRASFEAACSLTVAIGLDSAPYWVSTKVALGLIELEEGRIGRARSHLAAIDSLLPWVEETDPKKTRQKRFEAMLFRAEVLLQEDRLDEVIAISRNLPEVSIPAMGSAEMFFYNFPQDQDVFARAYVQKGALGDAISEYERLTTFDPASKDRRLINPMFHYRLGVVYEKKGLPDKAVRQYRKFLEICSDAEPPLAEVEDARRRAALLQK